MKRFYALLAGLALVMLLGPAHLRAQNYDRYITLTVKDGAEIKLECGVEEDNTIVKVESGSEAVTQTINKDRHKAFTLTAEGTTMTVYGDVSVLTCNYKGTKVTGLDATQNTGLIALHCQENALETFNIAGCTKLRYVHVEKNKLTEYDVSHCNEMVEIYCNDNQISTLKFPKGIKELKCQGNQIEELDLAECTDLKTVICGYNLLKKLTLPPNVTMLACSENSSLKSIDISGLTKLEYLYCNNCGLSELTLPTENSLSWLQCSNNQLEQLDLSGLAELRHLECSNNKLTQLNPTDCPNLNLIYLDGNPITTEQLDELYCALPVPGYGADLGLLLNESDPRKDIVLASNGKVANSKQWSPRYSELSGTKINPEEFTGTHTCDGIPIVYEQGDDLGFSLKVTNRKTGEVIAPNSSVAAGTEIVAELTLDEGYFLGVFTLNEDPITRMECGFTVQADEPFYRFKVIADRGFKVTITPPENGSIIVTNSAENEIPSGEYVHNGEIIMITTSPAEGYRTKEIKVNESTYADKKTTDVYIYEDITVSASFVEAKEVTIKITEPTNGSLSIVSQPDGTMVENDSKLYEGADILLTGEPAEGYRLNKFTVNGDDFLRETPEPMQHTVPVGVTEATFSAEFVAAEEKTLKLEASTNGTFEVFKLPNETTPLKDGDQIKVGDHLKVVTKPEDGFYVYNMTAGGNYLYPKDNSLDFYVKNTSGDEYKIFVYFNNLRQTTLQIEPLKNGTLKVFLVEGEKDTELADGASITGGSTLRFEAIPDEGYALEGIFVDDLIIKGVTYTLENSPFYDLKVKAVFTERLKTQVKIASPKYGTLKVTKEDGTAVENDETLYEGTVLTIIATPDAKCIFQSITVNEETFETNSITHVLTNAEECNISAIFSQIKSKVNIATPENGTLKVTYMKNDEEFEVSDGEEITAGVLLSITATPAEGYQLQEIKANDETFDKSPAEYTIPSDGTVVDISATFMEGTDDNTAVESALLAGVTVGPNPFGELLQVQNAAGIQRFFLRNTLGQSVLSGNHSGQNVLQLHTATLPSGLYLLVLQAEDGIRTMKVVKR